MNENFEIDLRIDVDLPVDENQLQLALQHALQQEQVSGAILSVTVVDNPTIHALNVQHLQHDYPTDVISFQLDWFHPDRSEPDSGKNGRSVNARIEGEIIVGGEYAVEVARSVDWPVQNELTLYVVHGMLHICGYDDLTPQEKSIMRDREKQILKGLGVHPEYPDDEPPGTADDNGRHTRPLPDSEEDRT